MNEEYPNLLIVNEQPETPDEIINEFLAEIIANKHDHEELLFILQDMFDKVSSWSFKEHLIIQTKLNLQQLEDLEELENYAEVDEDDE